MATITFKFAYPMIRGLLIFDPPAQNGPFDIVETVDDKVLDIDTNEAVRIVTPAGAFAGTYLGVTANGEVVINFNNNQILFSDIAYNVGDPAPVFQRIDFAICFASDTHLATPDGERQVQTLSVGDLVLKSCGQPAPIQWMGMRHLSATSLFAQPHLRPVTIAAGALGNHRPLTVSPEHRILIRGWRAELLFGAPEFLAPARQLVNGDTVFQTLPEDGVTYWHVMLEEHALLNSEGCWSESFNPDATAMTGLDDATRTEFLSLFPQFEGGEGQPPVRPMLTGGQRLRDL